MILSLRVRPRFWKGGAHAFLQVLLAVICISSLKAGGLRMAVFSPEGNREAEDLCVAALSSQGALQLVERRELESLLGEQALQRAWRTPLSAAQAGRLAGADVLLSVRMDGAVFEVEAVDAASGRILGRGEGGAGDLASKVLALVTAAPGPGRRPTVAVADFSGDGFKTSTELRAALAEQGFVVLDRALIEHAVAEHALRNAGLAEAGAGPGLAGADYLVEGRLRGGVLELRVLDTARGRLLASRGFARAPGLSQELAGWLAGLMPAPPPRKLTLAPVVQVEALVPLYEGIACFRDGNIRGALLAFWRAQELDDKFLEALTWEARCYDAIGLPPLADAVRRYSRECLVGRGISVPTRNIPAEGITFLGIQGASSPALEMKAVNALLKAAPGRVVLPDDLAAYRDEYDALTGSGGDASAWARAPGFLTHWSLRASPAPGGLCWTLFDTLSGRIVASETSEGFPFARLLASAKAAAAGGNHPGPDIGKNITWKKGGSVSEEQAANLDLIEKLASNPADPGLWGRGFKRDDENTERDGLQGFLNYAMREHLIAHLPEGNLHRAWLELIQIGHFLPWEPTGRLFSGTSPDPLKELEAFIRAHPADMPGAVARYMLLWEVMDSVPREALIGRCRETEAALQAAKAGAPAVDVDELIACTRHLGILAEVAAHGPSPGLRALPLEPSPRRIRPRLRPGGRVEMEGTTYWVCNEWNRVASPRELWQGEAVAAIHILGRRNNLVRVPASWLEDSPDSVALLDFAIEALHEVDHDYGAPFLHPMDLAAERENYLRIVAYCEQGLPRWLARTADRSAFSFASGYMARRYIDHLTRYGFINAVSDERFTRIQGNITKAVRMAAARLGLPAESGLGYWSRMPRRQSADVWSIWTSSANAPRDYDELMREEEAAARRSWADSPATQTAWWSLMHRWDGIGALRPQKRAQIALGHLGDMERIFPEKDDGLLGYREETFIFDYASLLLNGRRYAEAEPWFHRLADAPQSVLLGTASAREIRESARLDRAFCLLAMGRPDEALAVARQCMSPASEKAPFRLIEHIAPNQQSAQFGSRGSLTGNALRFLRDLRLATDAAGLPDNVRCLQIPIREGNGARLLFFLRIPPGESGAGPGTRKILVLAPSVNHGAEEYMQDSDAWARFADEQGLYLLVPEFFGWPDMINAYQNAADWSGEALLTAVAQVGREHPAADTRRFLLHGYGGGGQFVQRFVRWAPERCLGVSAHSAGDGSWMEGMPGLKPFAALRHVPLLVTCGADDDLSAHFCDRLGFSEQYVAAARDGGVPVIWSKLLKSEAHLPAPEMESLARLFLATCARGMPATPAFVGDLRNGAIVPAGDARVAQIPETERQPLPTAELAKAWERGFQ